jgi:AMMECR1 domain-containing protein
VGYGAWRFEPGEEARLPQETRAHLLGFSRKVLTSRFRRGKPPVIDTGSFPAGLQTWMASFVTLTIQGRLRGCIGSLAPRRSLVEDVAANAMAAALEDPRFRPMQAEDVPAARIKIALLSGTTPLHFERERQAVA